MTTPQKFLLALVFFGVWADVHAEDFSWEKWKSSALLVTLRDTSRYFCSAVILRADLALTAAHCVDKSSANSLTVGSSDSDSAAIKVEVIQEKIRIHPGYDPIRCAYCNDLAVLPLKTAVQLDVYASIRETPELRLRLANGFDSHTAFYRIGYGEREHQHLRTWTKIFFDSLSNQSLLSSDALSVPGDSGGPIFFENDGRLELVGIHSTALGEGQIAGPFVPDYTAWIFKN